MQPIENQFPMLVKFSDTESDDTDEVIFLQSGEHQVSVAKLIYEFIVLSIPIRHVHPDDEEGNSLCDPEMLKKIDEYRAVGSNDTDVADPRWNELRRISGN